MGIQKQPININFSQGLDTKTDPKQVQMGKFLSLKNSVFTKGGKLTKRNGYQRLTNLPLDASYATSFNGDLTALGSQIQAYSQGSKQWVNKGTVQPLEMTTLPVIRNNLNQTQSNSAIASNNLACVVYTENNGSANSYKYVVIDVVTGQNIVAPTVISLADATYGFPQVYALGNYFVIVYTGKVAAVYNLSYKAVSINDPTIVSADTIITTSYTPSTSVAFGGVVMGDNLYLSWNGAAASGIKIAYLTTTLALSPVKTVDAAHVGTIVSVCADLTNMIVWVSYYDSGASTGYTLAVNTQLAIRPNFPAQIISSGTILNLASAAQNGVNTVFYETSHTDTSIQTNFISSKTVTQSSGAVGSAVVVLRSVGIASQAFIVDGTIYLMGVYSSTYQPTYFLINGSLSTSASPVLAAKLAYENGGGYYTTGVPSVTLIDTTAYVTYLFKDLIQALSNANDAGTTTVGGIYSQTGLNLVSFNIETSGLVTSEIGANLNINGGFLWGYDGYSITEQGFHLWPDSVQNTATATTTGHLAAQIYYYQVTYEWTDNQGNAFRSAGSIPVKVDLSGSGTATNTVTLVIPTLRITAKTANPVKIVIYRWSTAQQIFYQVTSITAPTLNSTTTDSVTYVDTLADATILGNNILYTTGGVIEDIGAPSFKSIFLFDDRLFGISSEDPNLLWFSKQVIEGTPVEMSDLLTLFIAPNIGAQGPSGPLNCGFPLDDKAVLFKETSVLYFNGSGPDNTGSNSQYSQPYLITSTVGCSNQKSIVLVPRGLMFEFQSESGNQIWILGRDLSTHYIGADVEALTANAKVLSAVNIPGKNYVLFTLDSGITLMYDYYYEKWGTFVGIPSLSSTLYQGLHTFINQYGQVLQELPGSYVDGSNPVLIGFQTGWINLAALQGFERFYYFYFLGTYFSPHQLNVQLSYNYIDTVVQSDLITPDNFSASDPSAFGDQPAPFGSPVNLEQWKIHATLQKCQSFQITMQEVFDASLGVAPGAGFSLSGLDLMVAVKRGSRPINSSNTAGG